MKKPIEHVQDSKHLPDFLIDFHDQKDLMKTIWEWWGEQIEEKTDIKWRNAHVFVIDYFLWFMGIHGYKLQKDKTKNVEFRNIHETISEALKQRLEKFSVFYNKEANK